jgi:hypothetical protein
MSQLPKVHFLQIDNSKIDINNINDTIIEPFWMTMWEHPFGATRDTDKMCEYQRPIILTYICSLLEKRIIQVEQENRVLREALQTLIREEVGPLKDRVTGLERKIS